MSTIPSSTVDFAVPLPLKQFSSGDYLQMISAGLFGPDDRVELIRGMIVNMSPQGSRHNHFLMELNRLCAPLMERFVVAVQPTVTIGEGSVFDPDFVLLRQQPGVYKTRHPNANDILLVVEAADSSLARDQKVKLPIYARAGIQEYWIADLEQEAIFVHRDPQGEGYQSVSTVKADQVVSPLAAPDFSFEARQLFD